MSVTGLLLGCAAQTLRTPAAGLIAHTDWPPRITTGLEQLAANTPTLLTHDPQGPSLAGQPKHARQARKVAARVVCSAAYGVGIVLKLQHVNAREGPRPADETLLAFVSFSPLTRNGRQVGEERTRLPARIGWNDVCAGVQWRLYEAENSPPRGLVVHLGGNKYVRCVLLRRGWAVLSSAGTGRYFQRRASPQTFEIEGDEDLDEVAAQLATIIDDELADWPYSLEAVLQYLAEHRPDIPQEPMAIMGFSIGALGLPAVVARLPDHFQAAVVVAGGANLLEISQRSRKANRGFDLLWKGAEPARDDWQRLYAAYLQHAKLDPFHTAAALTGMPVLVFHAHFDQVVPAASGELLHARLGKPQRFAYPVGHRHLLRLVMRLEAERIAKWAEAAVSGPPPPAGNAHPN